MKIRNAIVPILAAAIAAFGPVSADEAKVIRLSEPVQVTDTHEVFGAPLPESGEVMQLAELMDNKDKYQGRDVLLETRIAKVCQKKGCFFVLQHGAETVRVTFRDYGFFIPTDAGGKTVLLAGNFQRNALSREQAEHLAEDLGEKAPEEIPDFEYAIVATAVSIPKA